MTVPQATDQALAYALRQLRLDRASTQEELAHEAGITVAQIARIERGQADPHWTTVRRIADALELSLVDLVVAIEDAPV